MWIEKYKRYCLTNFLFSSLPGVSLKAGTLPDNETNDCEYPDIILKMKMFFSSCCVLRAADWEFRWFGWDYKQELFIRKKCIFSGILSDGRYNILAFQLHHFHVWIDIKVQIKFIFVKRQIHFYLSRIQIWLHPYK